MSTDLAIFCGYEWHRVTEVLHYGDNTATVRTAIHPRLTGDLDTVVVHVSGFADRLPSVRLDQAKCSHPNYRETP